MYYQDGGRISSVYVGAPNMRGYGLGKWFAGIFRAALPYINKGVRAVGKEALRAGINVIDDVGERNLPLRESLRGRLEESTDNLTRAARGKIRSMTGFGYKSTTRKRKRQSSSKRGVVKKRRVSKKPKKRSKKKQVKKRARKQRKSRDIFD